MADLPAPPSLGPCKYPSVGSAESHGDPLVVCPGYIILVPPSHPFPRLVVPSPFPLLLLSLSRACSTVALATVWISSGFSDEAKAKSDYWSAFHGKKE